MKQAIEIIEVMIQSYIEADECGLSNNDFKHEIRALQTVLKEIENLKMEKDAAWEEWNNLEQSSYDEEKRLKAEIKRLKEDCKNLDKQAQQYFETTIIQSKQFNEELEKKDKIIDYMIDWIRERSIYAIDSHEKLKQYFEQKATNNG